MTTNIKLKRQHRIDNPESIEESLIESKIKDGWWVIIQWSSETYTDKMLIQLNKLCEKYDESFEVRFYGFYQSSFDCKILDKIPAVKALSLDSLRKVENIVSLEKLKNLKVLNLAVFELKDTEILRFDNFKKLQRLLIGETQTKALNLTYLKEYTNLTTLNIHAHTKNIKVVGELKNLEDLCLSSVSKVSFDFINNLKKLKELYIILGGRDNLNELDFNSIEHLSIVWVRGFKDLSCLNKFIKLKTLLIEDQIQLKKIDFTDASKYLEEIKIINCKTLNQINGVSNLEKLQKLNIYKTNIDYEGVIKNKLPDSLKVLTLGTGKISVDRKFAEILLNMGFPEQAERYKAVDKLRKENLS